MLMDRRSFIRSSVCAMALLPLTRISELSTESCPTETEADPMMYTIYGWDRGEPDENQICFRVNQCWRTAWR